MSLKNQNPASQEVQRRGPTKERRNLNCTVAAQQEAGGEGPKHLQATPTAVQRANPSNSVWYKRVRLSYSLLSPLHPCLAPAAQGTQGRSHSTTLLPRWAPSGEPCYKCHFHTAPEVFSPPARRTTLVPPQPGMQPLLFYFLYCLAK